MITVVRTADVRAGKMREDLAMAVNIATYLNDKLGAGNIQVIRNISGPANEVRWMETYESLADFDVFRQKLEADNQLEEHRDRGAEFDEFFKHVRVEIFETVS